MVQVQRGPEKIATHLSTAAAASVAAGTHTAYSSLYVPVDSVRYTSSLVDAFERSHDRHGAPLKVPKPVDEGVHASAAAAAAAAMMGKGSVDCGGALAVLSVMAKMASTDSSARVDIMHIRHIIIRVLAVVFEVLTMHDDYILLMCVGIRLGLLYQAVGQFGESVAIMRRLTQTRPNLSQLAAVG